MDKQQFIIPILLNNVKVFIVKGEKTIIFDAGRKGDCNKIISALKENGIDLKDVSLIIISHSHTDHYGDLYELKKRTGAKVAIHSSEAEYMKKGINSELIAHNIGLKILMKIFARLKVKGVQPEVLINEKLQLDEYGIEGVIVHTPGHTNGSLSVVLANGSAIVGDMIGGKYNLNTNPCIPGIYSDIKKLKESIQALLSYKSNTIYTSHGGTYKPSEVELLIKDGE